MGLLDSVFELEGPILWFWGLLFSTLVLASLGSAGLGSGASFNAWYLITDAIKAVVGINIVFGIIAFVLSILPLVIIVVLGLVGVRLFNNLLGPISLSETVASMTGGTSLQSVLVFALIVLLLL
ncbi:MAG: hypothetical protein Q8P02_03880 [Candidatus Micrarchaeota archaeon]|nr:hypothetical protein [Candidatus Micrarchaeota archaeon]